MILLPVLALLACFPCRAQAKMIDGIVAVVDSKVIMDSDLRKKMIQLGAPADNRSAERQVLELMVEDIVIEKIYKSLGFPAVGDSEAKKVSKDMQCDLDTARSYVMKSTLMDMMVRSRVVVTENMIKSYYDSHSEYQGRDSVHLKQIVVKNDEAKMQKVLAELKKGMPFDEAAKNFSDALPSGSPDIGWIAIEDLSEEVMKSVGKTKPGHTIGPVSIQGGGQILYQLVDKGVEGTRKLDEVRGEIQKTLEKKYQQEAFNYWLHKMMTQYFIGIYI